MTDRIAGTLVALTLIAIGLVVYGLYRAVVG